MFCRLNPSGSAGARRQQEGQLLPASSLSLLLDAFCFCPSCVFGWELLMASVPCCFGADPSWEGHFFPCQQPLSVTCNQKHPDSNTTLKCKLSTHPLLIPVSYPLESMGVFLSLPKYGMAVLYTGLGRAWKWKGGKIWSSYAVLAFSFLKLPLVISSLPCLIGTQCLGAREGPPRCERCEHRYWRCSSPGLQQVAALWLHFSALIAPFPGKYNGSILGQITLKSRNFLLATVKNKFNRKYSNS